MCGQDRVFLLQQVDAIVARKHGKEERKSFIFEVYVFLSVFL